MLECERYTHPPPYMHMPTPPTPQAERKRITKQIPLNARINAHKRSCGVVKEILYDTYAQKAYEYRPIRMPLYSYTLKHSPNLDAFALLVVRIVVVIDPAKRNHREIARHINFPLIDEISAIFEIKDRTDNV